MASTGVIRQAAMSARHHSHENRAQLFLDLMRPLPGMRVLDLGSGAGDPFVARLRRVVDLEVTLADITDDALADAATHGFRGVLLREDEPLPFDDGAFDIVLSNSVIEHVTLPKADCLHTGVPSAQWHRNALERQIGFASEIRRVGRGYFVQTPHKHFPLDLHTWLPFTNWLPHNAAVRLVRVTNRYWVKQCGCADWNLLGEAEMRALFPEAQLHVERLMGLPKSIIAYKAPV